MSLLVVVLAVLVCGCGASDAPKPHLAADYRGTPAQVGGLQLPARVRGDYVELSTAAHGFQPRFWPGVNLGSTVPGRFPGELAQTRADYRRWLPEMAALGTRALRVYTILPPAFYQELRRYDLAHPAAPVYVIHGAWIPEERFMKTRNAYDPEVQREFKSELTDVVSVVHGDADLPRRRGHASGHYGADISPWLLAWSIGVEWDPLAVRHTLKLNPDVPAYHGRYITTRGTPNAMESWIASHLDYVASLEAKRGWSRPITFTNWLTADPLEHPSEPSIQEDFISIDAMHMRATTRWPAGFFASYHVYPYYPEFLKLDKGYQTYKRPDGKTDPYAGYLHALKAHHKGQAVMVTEFGQPSALGIAHTGPLGRNQGGHSEADSAAKNADLMSAIEQEHFAGGLVFEWADEWFKFTWNTKELELPGERRSLWRNPLTNEEHFGLVAEEPGAKHSKVVVDGDGSEWDHRGHSPVTAESRGPVREVRTTHDEEYLYLRLMTDKPAGKVPVTVGLDIQPGTNAGLPGLGVTMPEADVALTLDTHRRATLRLAAWTDILAFQYGVAQPFMPVDRAELRRGSGAWHTPRLILNRPFVARNTGEQHHTELADIGRLRWGTANPKQKGFDDRVLVASKGHTIEVRLPWMMLGYSDPSSHQVMVPHSHGPVTSRRTGRIEIETVAAGQELRTAGYDWDDWNVVASHERRKVGWDVLAAEFDRAAAPPK
ncbi:MAG: hypothetical protein ABI611_00830 [Solirubrobacteraceae bacterium]